MCARLAVRGASCRLSAMMTPPRAVRRNRSGWREYQLIVVQMHLAFDAGHTGSVGSRRPSLQARHTTVTSA